MRKKILRQEVSLLIVALLITLLAVTLMMYRKFENYMVESVKEEAEYVRAAVEQSDGAYLDNLVSEISDNTRITRIASDGTVLYDSREDAADMPNHGDRPEVQEALESGVGEEVRYSETIARQTFYYAVLLDDGSVLRLSRSMDSVFAFLRSGLALLGFLAAGIILIAFFVVRAQTMRLIEPINRMDLEHPLEQVSYEELRPLLGRVQEQNIQISRQMQELKETEQLRREFSANVSHELKTPLMSISGYAELIENGIARTEDVPEFARRIHQEALRLTNLVQDIIQLSKLEGGTSVAERETVDLYEMCGEVVESLRNAAQKRGIDIAVEGAPSPVLGVRQILYEMVYNLADNAIRYNRDGGWVRVRCLGGEDAVWLEVQDNGIGIAKEEQERVYERFYRVDKSHSRQTGGTGLGLSIVKHGAILHGASINTASLPGKGTTITVTFPLEQDKE